MGDDNVVYLAFKAETVVSSKMAFHACRCCGNKTYTLTEDVPLYFPLVRCAACGQHMGRIGWVPEDQPAGEPAPGSAS